jgi:hypothetical protein
MRNFGNILFAMLILLFAGAFYVIGSNGKKWNAHIQAYTKECERRGGEIFIPKGVKGWPEPECRNPLSTVKVD